MSMKKYKHNNTHNNQIETAAIIQKTYQIEAQNCLVNSSRNIISEWAVIFRYENFFIPRVENSSKLSPLEKKPYLAWAYGSWEGKIFCPWANFF